MDAKMEKNGGRASQLFAYIGKSEFIRSLFLETMAVFLVVILLIVAVMFNSFGTEINESTIAEQKNQLNAVEETISSRMEEVTSIAYNIGQDTTFYLEPVAEEKYSGYEMSTALSRYLVGNKFIEYLAYYRLSEPDKVFTSSGELPFVRFWDSYLECDNYTQESFLKKIMSQTGVQLVPLSNGDDITFFTYVCPLPQFSMQPRAFVFALIPHEDIAAPLYSQLASAQGEITLFDARGDMIYEASTLQEDISAPAPDGLAKNKQTEFSVNGGKYSAQYKVSSTNGWKYVSIVRLNSVFSQLAKQQIAVILTLVLLMIAAVFAIMLGIIRKYKPISNLAMTLTDEGGIVDEKKLISTTIETLKSDSEQKQKFEAAYQEANEASRAKSVFLSNMSHDIRTPMNAIIGMMDLAQKHIDDSAYVRDCLQKADVASHYLLELINNVLDMSRIESGKVTLSERTIRLPEFISGLVTIIRPSIKEKRQLLIMDTDGVVNEAIVGDEVRLSQICMNILSNATKFTPDEGTIRFELREKPQKKAGFGEYELVISDNGIGMSADYVDQVFDMFSRANESGISKIEGTGLGMAITKNLVDMMGGNISCESEQGVGTAFKVALSMKLAPEAAQSTLEIQEKLVGKTALIFSEDEGVCAHQSALLGGLGIAAECCESAESARELLRRASNEQKAYSYALLNLKADEEECVNALLKLVKEMKTPETRLILGAADFSDIDKALATEAGIDYFVRLPLFKSAFLNMFKDPQAALSAKADEEEIVLQLEGKRILLAEDNYTNRVLAHTFISETGAEVTDAVNGKEAVEAFEAHPAGYFDVILMDVKMPEMDGLAATAAIRKMDRPDAVTIPIYAMTANTFDDDVNEVLNAGMNGHLGKPYTSNDLYKLLKIALFLPSQEHSNE